MGIVQLAESQGATHAKTTQDRTRSPSILRDFQADLDAGLNVNQACRKAGIATDHLLPLEGPPGCPFTGRTFCTVIS